MMAARLRGICQAASHRLQAEAGGSCTSALVHWTRTAEQQMYECLCRV